MEESHTPCCRCGWGISSLRVHAGLRHRIPFAGSGWSSAQNKPRTAVDVPLDEIDDPESRFLECSPRSLRWRYGSRSLRQPHLCHGLYKRPPMQPGLFRVAEKSGRRFLCMPTARTCTAGRFDSYPKRRGHHPRSRTADAGLKVASARTSIRDPWYPTAGNGNPLRILMWIHACYMLA